MNKEELEIKIENLKNLLLIMKKEGCRFDKESLNKYKDGYFWREKEVIGFSQQTDELTSELFQEGLGPRYRTLAGELVLDGYKEIVVHLIKEIFDN